MTTTEHLEKIKAKCLELLAIAEKRTPGRWYQQSSAKHLIYTHPCGGLNLFAVDDRELANEDAAFIASAAGPFEASLKSTIAAIDSLQKAFADYRSVTGAESLFSARSGLQQIIAAWPIELLS